MMTDTISLTHDGDETWVGDVGYRLTVQPDPWETGDEAINSRDDYGRVAWITARRDSLQGCFSGRADDGIRPGEFTGAAEKLADMYGHRFWWEPYRDDTKIYNSDIDRQYVIDMINYGPQEIIVERLERLTDSRGNTHVVVVEQHTASGLEPFIEADYVAEIVANLLAEFD
jgi:hypothetical protein